LTSLLKKDAFNWTEEAQVAFDSLKHAMVIAPVLSGVAMGAVLIQDNHPIAFFSKAFNTKLAHSSTYLRELHAITNAVKR
jgi:hypothetical protein